MQFIYILNAITNPNFKSFPEPVNVPRHKANDGVVYAIRAWFKNDTALSGVV